MYDVGSFNSLVEDDDPLKGFVKASTGKIGYDSEAEIPGHVLDAAVADMGNKELRASGMATALTWIEEGEYTSDFLDGLVAGMAAESEDDIATDAEDDFYKALRATVGDALVALGGSADQVSAMVDGDDDAGEELGGYLSDKMDNTEKSDSELITSFAVGSSLVLDAAKKVIRNGKVVLKKKRLKKVHLNSKQKAALKKAQRKAHNSAARRARKKSMRIRNQRGL